MYQQLGPLLKGAREKLGLEQGQVAEALGIGQQAVSTWERGRSRPRRPMVPAVAQILATDEEELLAAGGYLEADALVPSVQRSRTLPAGMLPPERFEDLVTGLLGFLYPEGHASLFGGPGEKQFGIDVVVTGADGRNLAAAQCKRHVQFGAAAVADAVASVTVSADKYYLFLSRQTASPTARAEMTKHPGWELWDGEDISRFIRLKLPPDSAVRLVDAYFPGHREAFLGVPAPGPWLVPEDYFAHNRGQLFSHEWSLAGRREELSRLAGALYGSAGTLGILVGRGGIGKTRLLRALAESCPQEKARVLVLPAGATVEAAAFELLPRDRRLAVLIDDAHDRDDLAWVVSGIWRRNASAGILVATRPYRVEGLRSDLARAAALPDDYLTVEIGDLPLPAAEALAREALGGSARAAVAHRLAALTRDCPLVTVAGGALIRRGQLNPSQLEHDGQVRNVILQRFRDALVCDPAVADPDTRSSVLDAVAALQPFRTDDDSFRRALGAIVGKPYDVLGKHLRNLEEAGILLRRGAAVRIVPDLLGDVVLAQAAYDEHTHAATGYLDRVRSAADSEALQHLFVNVSRVDWQIRQDHRSSPSLADGVWASLETELHGAGIEGRREIVHLLARVSYFEPDRVVGLARWLIANPSSQLEDEASARWAFLGKPTYRDVLSEIPTMLKPAAYNLATLPAVLHLLWELAQGDGRPANQSAGHPLRVLQELAAYEMTKPTEYNAAVVETVSSWFADGQDVSPFDVLEPLLATEGNRTTYQAHALTFQPFPLDADAVNPVRELVIALALEEAQRNDVRRAAAGISTLSAAMRYPSGMYGRSVTTEERNRWTPGFISTIEQLGAVASRPGIDPVVVVAVRKALHWHAVYSDTATQRAAAAILDNLRNDLSERVALVIHDAWGHLAHSRQHPQREEETRRRLDDVICDLGEMTDEEVTALLTQRLAKERLAFGPNAGQPGFLIADLVQARPSLALPLRDLAISGEVPALTPFLPVILAAHAGLHQDDAASQARELLALQDPAVARAVAQSLGLNRGHRPLAAGERELLLEFASNADLTVRQAPAIVAARIADKDPATACELLSATDFTDSPQLADEVFMCFAKPFGLTWERLTEAQVTAIRSRLVPLDELFLFRSITFSDHRR